MPDENYRHIQFIIDRSGSMHDKKNDTEGGLKALLAEQAQAPGRTTVSLVEFDTFIDTVYAMRDIGDLPEYRLEPRGGTALLDAVGSSIIKLRASIKALPKAERPGEVVVVIMTDGEENSSREWRLDDLKKLISKRRKKGWNFLFLGADIDAFSAATGMGIGHGQTLSYTGSNSAAAFATTSTVMTRATASGTYAYTDDDRAATGTGDV